MSPIHKWSVSITFGGGRRSFGALLGSDFYSSVTLTFWPNFGGPSIGLNFGRESFGVVFTSNFVSLSCYHLFYYKLFFSLVDWILIISLSSPVSVKIYNFFIAALVCSVLSFYWCVGSTVTQVSVYLCFFYIWYHALLCLFVYLCLNGFTCFNSFSSF